LYVIKLYWFDYCYFSKTVFTKNGAYLAKKLGFEKMPCINKNVAEMLQGTWERPSGGGKKTAVLLPSSI